HCVVEQIRQGIQIAPGLVCRQALNPVHPSLRSPRRITRSRSAAENLVTIQLVVVVGTFAAQAVVASGTFRLHF
ncbi:MAG: hypothetical protein M3Q29_22675, partial [Chloroflexota bacterium]|nr:hypothetical protein [Chloroflexota bacterium]